MRSSRSLIWSVNRLAFQSNYFTTRSLCYVAIDKTNKYPDEATKLVSLKSVYQQEEETRKQFVEGLSQIERKLNDLLKLNRYNEIDFFMKNTSSQEFKSPELFQLIRRKLVEERRLESIELLETKYRRITGLILNKEVSIFLINDTQIQASFNNYFVSIFFFFPSFFSYFFPRQYFSKFNILVNNR